MGIELSELKCGSSAEREGKIQGHAWQVAWWV